MVIQRQGQLKWYHSDGLVEEWKQLISGLEVPSPIVLPRNYISDVSENISSVTLVRFCDASTQAYAAVVYIQFKTGLQHITRFVASKSRVAPLQTQTIPRLELLSALLLSKLIVSVHDIRGQKSISSVSDSKIALYWITCITKNCKVFIENRVKEIQHNVSPNSTVQETQIQLNYLQEVCLW